VVSTELQSIEIEDAKFQCYIQSVAKNKFADKHVGMVNRSLEMSKVCEICGKHPVAGRNVSHSHRVTNRTFKPNIQRVTIKDKNGRVRKANVCTSCLKAGKVERA
jgi:large subunit ribosomal protein L28